MLPKYVKNMVANELTDRLSTLARALGYQSVYKLEQECHVGKNNFSNGNPSAKYISQLFQRFPGVNANWVLTGNGEMFLCEEEKDADAFPLQGFSSILAEPPVTLPSPKKPEEHKGSPTAHELALMRELIDSLRAQLNEKERVIQTKDAYIDLLTQQINNLNDK